MFRRPRKSPLFPSPPLSRPFLEAAELAGTVRSDELTELADVHGFDVLELESLRADLERRGIEVLEPEPLPLVEAPRSEEHTSELQSRQYLVCRLLLEKKKKK